MRIRNIVKEVIVSERRYCVLFAAAGSCATRNRIRKCGGSKAALSLPSESPLYNRPHPPSSLHTPISLTMHMRGSILTDDISALAHPPFNVPAMMCSLESLRASVSRFSSRSTCHACARGLRIRTVSVQVADARDKKARAKCPGWARLWKEQNAARQTAGR